MFDFENLKFWKKVSKDESGVVKEWAVKEAWEFRNRM